MSFARSRSDFLAARDARQALLDDACRRARDSGRQAVLFIGVNIPGAEKNRPGLEGLVEAGLKALIAAGIDATLAASAVDLLGPYRVLLTAQLPAAVKAATVAIESSLPGGRVLDLDVLTAAGDPVDRQGLGLEPRRCYVCDQPARECMLLARHTLPDLLAAVDAHIALARAA
jgi:holo-ACP synthase